MARRMGSVVLSLIFLCAGHASALVIASVQVSNHTNSEVDITWVTDVPASTSVRYGTTPALGSTTTGSTGEIHRVRLTGLLAETPYFFEVISDGQVDNKGGNFYQFKTAKVGFGNFHTLFGFIKDGQGQPVTGAQVVLTVGVSLPLSSLTDNNGVWSVDLTNLKNQTTGDVQSFANGDTVSITADAPGGKRGNHTLMLAQVESGFGQIADIIVSPTVPPAGVVIQESGGSTQVVEGGFGDTYTVVLTSQPTANVTVTVTPDTQVSVSPSTLTFTPASFNVPQTVTVTAVDDALVEGTPHTGILTHRAASADVNYNSVAIASVTATITDNDTIHLSVSPTPVGFGTVTVGQSADQTLTMTNLSSSTGTLTGSVDTLSNPFSVVSGGGSFSLTPGQSWPVVVRFSPTALGATSGTLAITHNATNQSSPTNIPVSGTGRIEASVLAIRSAGTVFEGDALEVTLEMRDANGVAATSANPVPVRLSSSSTTGTFDPATVTLPAGATSAKVSYKDTKAGSPTLTASATGLTSGTQVVTVNSAITNVTVSGSPVKAGGKVTVTAVGKPHATATFSIGAVVTDQAMVESATGTYTGEFTPVVHQHPDGTYDVVVKIHNSLRTVTGGVVIDTTAPVLSAVTANPATIQNGQTLTLTVVAGEGGLSVTADISTLDSNQPAPVPLEVELRTQVRTYSVSIVISENNAAENGPKTLTITATDAAGNAVETSTIVDLRNFAEFDLFVPDDIGTLHIPLKVAAVGTQAKALKTIGDLFDALGANNVNFIITRDTEASVWRSYLGARSRGTPADRLLTDDLGMITVMKNPVTLRLRGDAFGTDGKSTIHLKRGTNLVGIPLKDARLTRVSDLLSLEGIKDNATSIIVSDNGTFKVVARPGDPGDIAITGGQSFIITARAGRVAEVMGEAWDNVSGSPSAAPQMTLVGHKVDDQTPVLAVNGAVVDEITGVAQDGFRITVQNVSTGAFLNTVSGSDAPEGRYSVTFVEASNLAAQVGDVLEITVDTGNLRIGVQPLRHIVTTDEVKASQIQLANLIAYEIPAETKLLPNYPNPFNPETWIPYRLAKDSVITLIIYDTTGKLVRTIPVGHKHAAVYESKDKAIYWDGRNDFGERVASGIYFYNFTAKDFTATRKMVILK